MSQHDFRDLVAKYGVFLGRRDTYKRKALLVATLKQEIEPYGYPVKGIADKVRFSKAINIHIGNVDHAQTLVVAHYDQPNRMFFAHGEFDPFTFSLNSSVKTSSRSPSYWSPWFP